MSASALGSRRRRAIRPTRTVLAVVAVTSIGACRETLRFEAPGCANDIDCPGAGATRCEPTTASCVACLVDGDCLPLALHHCDRTQFRCIDCANDGECGSGRACRSNRCVTTCTMPGRNDDPACPTGLAHCEGQGRYCVMCENDDSCLALSRTTPLCAAGMCVACTSDASCGDGTHCDPLGRCVQCLIGAHCAASSGVCNPVSGTCAEL